MDIAEKVAALWLDDKTGKEIAAEMGMSRNAVLGLIYRLRASGAIPIRDKDKDAVRKAPDGRKRSPRRRPAPKPKVERKPSRPRKLAPLPATELTELAWSAPNPHAKRLDALTFADCRFITSGVGLTALFCGRVKERGAYCAEHGAICYVDPKTRPRRNRPVQKLRR